MATRTQAREAVIQILYAKELGNEQAVSQAEYFLNEQKIRNKQQEFALDLLHGVCSNEQEIVHIMNVFLRTWDIERLGIIEKSILKLGIYELQQTNTQKAVVINEAIELTKSFNVCDAFRLVNGVLDSIAKTDSKTLVKLVQDYKKAKQNSINQKAIEQDLQSKSFKDNKNQVQEKTKSLVKYKSYINENQNKKTDSKNLFSDSKKISKKLKQDSKVIKIPIEKYKNQKDLHKNIDDVNMQNGMKNSKTYTKKFANKTKTSTKSQTKKD